MGALANARPMADQTVLICNKCGTRRTLVSDETADTFRKKPCWNPDCDAVGDFRKEISKGLSSTLGFSGDLTTGPDPEPK